MIKTRFIFLFFLFVIANRELVGQKRISGKVIAKDDGGPLPGVSVFEKGTTNGTVTNIEGVFVLNIRSKNSILVFSFIGYHEKEIALSGKEKIEIELKPECHIDWFDAQDIGIFINSGTINNPLGGRIDISFPAFFKQATFKNWVSYQSDLNQKQFVSTQVGLYHLLVSCNFNADINWYYNEGLLNNELTLRSNSIEGHLNFNSIKLIIGYNEINKTIDDSNEIKYGSGILLGIGTWVRRPFNLMLLGKVAINQNLPEYQVVVNKNFKKVKTFIKYYKVNSFNELSLGIGFKFHYRLRKPKI